MPTRAVLRFLAMKLWLAFAALSAFALGAPPTETDEYTRYELLEPASSQFRILYEVTATEPGAEYFFNPIRRGSEASRESVADAATGKALTHDVVSGEEARRAGLKDAETDVSYLRIRLPRPVPREGGVRLRIDKTYKDPKSYFEKGDTVVFSRSLGIRRNSIVLPKDFELVGCSVSAQVLREGDGRLQVSFMNPSVEPASVVVTARRLR
jgi:hypothetical protein